MASSWDISTDPRRVLLLAFVTDIPGSKQKRFHTLGNDFSQFQLKRSIRDEPSLSGYDHPHIPGDFDSETALKRWFIYDFNVKGPLTKEQTLAVPHEVFIASRQGEEWIFVPRNEWVKKAKHLSSSYTWGGRAEQRDLAELNKASN
ncbi:hypothetical protein IQ07DRAFT_582200 [Pyrenochaeta sp. DS3sAY3a]|nr:hypothetical protein IQ07DRAFT_582200 [Pyrenochaeta sp. DS3sAY3a]